MNFIRILGSTFLLLTLCNTLVKPANILGLYTMDVKSHYLIAQNLLRELAKSGHNVTVFTGFKSNDLPENYKEITLKLESLDGKYY